MVISNDNKKTVMIDPLTDTRWDKFVDQHPHGWICHLSGWKKVIENSFPHIRGDYLVITDEKGHLVAGLPVFLVKSPLTGKRMVSIPFATLFDPLVRSVADMKTLLDAAIRLAHDYRTPFLDFRAFRSLAYENETRLKKFSCYAHHYLDLTENPDALKKKFHRTCVRQRINRALDKNVRLVIGQSETDLKAFYSLYLLTRKRTHLPPMPYRFFKALWTTFDSGTLLLLLARFEEKTVAGLILFKYKNRVSAEFAASDERYKFVSPNHFLFWQAIRMACHGGYTVFDFGRTSMRNKPLLDFKRHWGTVSCELPNYIYTENERHHTTSTEDKFSYKLVKNATRLIPLTVYPAFLLSASGVKYICFRTVQNEKKTNLFQK